jgi:hypothetical protein
MQNQPLQETKRLFILYEIISSLNRFHPIFFMLIVIFTQSFFLFAVSWKKNNPCHHPYNALICISGRSGT